MRFIRRAVFLMGALVAIAVLIYFVARFADPVVNYYGVRMRDSQFHNYILAHPPADPNTGIYCYAEPLTNIHEQSICFDTEAELDLYLQRKHTIEADLHG